MIKSIDAIAVYALEAHCVRHCAENDLDGFMVPQPVEDMFATFSPHLWAEPASGGRWQRVWTLLGDDGNVRGHVVVTGNPYAPHRCYLGMGLERAWRGKGYGGQMMDVALRWCEAQPELSWCDGQALADNHRVIGLDRSRGWYEVGRVPDVLRRDGHSVAYLILTRPLRS